METLIETVGSSPKEFFLNFSSKEEYLQKVQVWKSLYKLLSHAIRHNKKASKARLRAQSLVQHRMTKAGKCWFVTSNYAEYLKRRDKALSMLPNDFLHEPYDPTLLLKIRSEMKVKSVRQMRGY
jgi:2-keto-4-pentenoate hydratase/2-oxohepta-3-ene-1,7-dioic acid hydratase in catechol pathway